MAECNQCFKMSDGTIKLCYECLEAENKALKKRAESAEGDWQLTEDGVTGACYGCEIKRLKAEIQEVSNQLLNLYTECNKTTRPEVYGTILGLHERLEQLPVQ